MSLKAHALQEALLPGQGTLAASEKDAFKFALHPSRATLAAASQHRLVIYTLRQGPATSGTGTAAVTAGECVGPVLACSPGENITALRWTSYAASTAKPGDEGVTESVLEDSCLLVGLDSGFLQLHAAASGALMHRQQLHDGPVVAIQTRSSGMGLSPGDTSGDVTISFADAVARILGPEMRGVPRMHLRRGNTVDQLPPLSVSKWSLHKATGPRTAALCLGAMPPTLYSLLSGQHSEPKSAIITAGANPPLAIFEVEEQQRRGVIAAVAGMASSLRGWLPSPTGVRQAKGPQLQAAQPSELYRSMWDDPSRGVTSLSVAPRGSLAATTDSLGRVMLWDTAAVAALRIWKGYRDAQCAWLLLPEPAGSRGTPAPTAGGAAAAAAAGAASPVQSSPNGSPMDHDAAGGESPVRADYDASPDGAATPPAVRPAFPGAAGGAVDHKGHKRKALKQGLAGGARTEALHLVIYAPRRGVLELWPARQGLRLRTVSGCSNGRLVPADPAFGTGADSQYAPGRECLLLDLDTGAVTLLSRVFREADL